MKARADDRRIFDSDAKPNIVAIQDSQGLDAAGLTHALNSPINKEDVPKESLFEEIDEEKRGLFSKKALAEKGHVSESDIAALLELFDNAKTFGSLIQIPPKLAAKLPEIEKRLDDVLKHGDLTHASAHVLKPLLQQAWLLARQYDAVVANPPYMGGKYFAGTLKEFVADQYTQAKADLYACFIQRNLASAKPSGFVGMITIPNWMFLTSFEELRKSLLADHTIDTFIHNGRGVFGSDFGSCAFALCNAGVSAYRGSYRRLFEKQGSVAGVAELEERFHTAHTYTPVNADFAAIPASPVAYWLKGLGNFARGTISQIAESGGRFKTHNDDMYVRYWWEVSSANRYWKRYLKGGECRRFYGNEYHVVDWRPSALASYESHGGMANPKYLQREGITCSKITAAISSFRLKRDICEYSSVSPTIFPKSGTILQMVLAFLNSKVADYYLSALNPSITTNVNDILAEPDPSRILSISDQTRVAANARVLVNLAHEDWDSFETSRDFHALSVCRHTSPTVRQSMEAADVECFGRLSQMKTLEEQNNRIFIDAYGLQDELSSEVADDEITLYRPNLEEDIKRLLSYAIGCVMGRYSLDKPGLIYAHSGNQGFDPGQYKTFRADDDGIIPLLETDLGIRDDATNRFEEFVSVAWPNEHLEENLKFVADSLGSNTGEQPRDTIRRYLATGFYKHHLSMYKKRPIYWLFSSGKQRAFQCLVYQHRYHEGTLARMRTEYVIPLQGQIAARIEQLEGDKSKATSTSHRKKLQKEQDDLKKQEAELLTFEEKLKHAADQLISLDLDDGVKVNYAKFADLLAAVDLKGRVAYVSNDFDATIDTLPEDQL